MSRDSETRSSRQRGGNMFESLRDLPPEMIPDGIEALWVNEEVRGERQRTNLMVRMNRDGYVPLTTSQLPGFADMAALDEDRPTDDKVRWGGQILMGRPKQYGIEDRRDQIAAAKAAEEDAKRGSVAEGLDPRLAQPDRSERTRVTRERARPQFEE